VRICSFYRKQYQCQLGTADQPPGPLPWESPQLHAPLHSQFAAGCDCSAVPLVNAPVLGANCLTFVNRCTALCQGVAVAAPGACSTGEACLLEVLPLLCHPAWAAWLCKGPVQQAERSAGLQLQAPLQSLVTLSREDG